MNPYLVAERAMSLCMFQLIFICDFFCSLPPFFTFTPSILLGVHEVVNKVVKRKCSVWIGGGRLRIKGAWGVFG